MTLTIPTQRTLMRKPKRKDEQQKRHNLLLKLYLLHLRRKTPLSSHQLLFKLQPFNNNLKFNKLSKRLLRQSMILFSTYFQVYRASHLSRNQFSKPHLNLTLDLSSQCSSRYTNSPTRTVCLQILTSPSSNLNRRHFLPSLT